jgi:nicotinate dehydrogenase subunit B
MNKSENLFEEEEFNIPDTSHFNRRNFLKQFSSGLLILFSTGELFSAQAQQARRRRRNQYPSDLNAYLRINENGRVSCFTGKIEMGQGIITSLAQMLAEELEVPLDSVDMVMGDTKLCPYDGSTTGSRSTKYFGPPLRRAAAEAKTVLLQLAADHWGIPEKRLFAKNGIIFDKENDNTKISYAQIVKGKKITRKLKGQVTIKHHSTHTISGKVTFRIDSLQKVTGEAKFSGDIRLPGMLYAKVLRPPSHGAKLKSVDVKTAQNFKGIKVIKEDDLVAVLHENPEQAELALNSIKAEWVENEYDVDNKTIFEHLQKSVSSSNISAEKGNLDEGKKLTSKSFETTFRNHYVAHAPSEPYTLVVAVDNGEAKVWASTQAPFRVRNTVANTLNLPVEKVHVITPFVGCGFGGKKSGRQVEEATRLALLTGRPVQLAWTRKEEFFYDAFRPAAVIKTKSGLNKSGKIVYWDFEIIFTGSRSSTPIYNIPHYRVTTSRAKRGTNPVHPFNTGAWRGPGSNTNVFAMESQTDIMAKDAGTDPLSFRLKNLSDERMKRVLKAAASKLGFSFSKGPSGKGYGIACTDYLNTYVATIAEVKVNEKSGEVNVKRIVCAQDMGEIINPQGATIQIEGGLTMGLGSALTEEIHFKGAKVLDENFDTYEITKFSSAPKIDVVLIDNPDLPPQGCGEPATTTIGAVIANAIYDAVGVRMFELPMTPDKILRELKKG